MLTAAQKNQIVELRAKGHSFEKISKQLHISKQTLIKKTRELEDVIVNLRKTEIEELQEKHFLNKRQRLQTYGDMLKRLQDEIEACDLSSLPPDKLIDLYIRLYNQIKPELMDSLQFQQDEDLCEPFCGLKSIIRWQG